MSSELKLAMRVLTWDSLPVRGVDGVHDYSVVLWRVEQCINAMIFRMIFRMVFIRVVRGAVRLCTDQVQGPSGVLKWRWWGHG